MFYNTYSVLVEESKLMALSKKLRHDVMRGVAVEYMEFTDAEVTNICLDSKYATTSNFKILLAWRNLKKATEADLYQLLDKARLEGCNISPEVLDTLQQSGENNYVSGVVSFYKYKVHLLIYSPRNTGHIATIW